MAPLGFFKNIKEFGKKVARKVGGAINKVGKVVKDVKDKLHLDKALKYVPYGDIINDAVDIGTNVAVNAGEALENVGKGKNVVKEAKNAAKKIWQDDKTRDTVIKTGKKVIETTNQFLSNPDDIVGSGIQNENVYKKRQSNNVYAGGGYKQRPSFLDNQLN